MLEMYMFGGILIITILAAVFMTRKDSVMDEGENKSKYKSEKSGNRKKIVREGKAGRLVRMD